MGKNYEGPGRHDDAPSPSIGQLPGRTETENRPISVGAQQPRKAIEEPQLFIGLQDGRSHLGYLIPRSHDFEAVLPDGVSLGHFNDETAAARALIVRRLVDVGRSP
jgi:hypothetical protein